MADTPEQTEFRRHLGEMRMAAGGIGRDMEVAFRSLETKINQMPRHAGKDLKYFVEDIESDFHHLGREIDDTMSKIPGALSTAGSEIARAAVAAKTRTADALHTAGQKASETRKNVFARAAGVRRTPMKEWRHPTASDEGD
ncbi:MAG TPA: hypothetical protein VMH78_06345 [Thermoplasmata archaeon]|nr:hypothetical protein [Thermoplasmata archaeon]